MKHAGLRLLEAAFGSGTLAVDIEPRYLGDWLVAAGPEDQPMALLRPNNVDDISRALAICNEHRIPVVPQGGRTGLAGGATPIRNALLISLERMNAIEGINVVSRTAVVQAGVLLQTLQEAASQSDLIFPLDIGARGTCQIGGNIATNAGGNRVLRYGMTRNMVLGLEVVLADGTIVSAMNHMMKNNAGYDVKQMFVGSEGTLGVITRAVVRLYSKPLSTAVALTAHSDYRQLEQFLADARSRLDAGLTAFEVMWPEFYAEGVARTLGAPPLPNDAGIYALLEVSASDDRAEAHLRELLEYSIENAHLEDATLARSVQQVDHLWSIRDVSGELAQAFTPVCNFDVSFPTSGIHDFVNDCRERLHARWPGMRTLFFGHIVDGNVHLIAGDFTGREEASVEELVYGCVRDHGGSISAEHGIGLHKREYLGYSRSEPEIALMRRLKNALDPRGILNPGKILI